MIFDFWILCALQVNRVVFIIFLELQRRRSGKLEATSRHANVATSGQQKKKPKSDPMSRHCDIATFPRFLLQNYKKHGGPNLGVYRRTYKRSAKNEATATREIEKTVFVFIFSKLFMIYRTMPILNFDMF